MLALMLLLVGCADPVVDEDTAPPGASDYCEATVDLFCPFYLRCGWTAAIDEASCRDSFLETCNAVYEPRWVALADAGLLELDPDGLAACEEHLSTLTCGAQQTELQGPCGELWNGLVPEGGGCGVGLENFVCDDSSACVLDLSFCGTCKPMVADGEACSTDLRCARESACVDDVCVARARLGEVCSEAVPCYVGAQCAEGVCTDDERVAVGDSCGAGLDCPYTASCVSGTCVADALLGESCTSRNCASGWCDGAVCQTFKEPGDLCSAAQECGSYQCDDAGRCGELLSTCVTE